MDPVTYAVAAIANVIAAILNYSTENRKTMSQENRDTYDRLTNERIAWWQGVAEKVAASIGVKP